LPSFLLPDAIGTDPVTHTFFFERWTVLYLTPLIDGEVCLSPHRLPHLPARNHDQQSLVDFGIYRAGFLSSFWNTQPSPFVGAFLRFFQQWRPFLGPLLGFFLSGRESSLLITTGGSFHIDARVRGLRGFWLSSVIGQIGCACGFVFLEGLSPS